MRYIQGVTLPEVLLALSLISGAVLQFVFKDSSLFVHPSDFFSQNILERQGIKCLS